VLHKAGTATLDGAGYTYDNAGNRTTKTTYLNNITEQYIYDPLYQLTQVIQGTTTTESYSYDAVGNRISSLGMSPYAYNSSNELTSTPSASFTYDSNGNTLTKADSSGTTTYNWGFENRLTSVVLPETGGMVTFKYDPFGRRIQKSSSNGTTNYLYDGSNSVAEIDNAGTLLANYEQSAGVDEPLAELRNGDLFRAYLTSTRTLLLSEPAKSRVWVSTISVDSFGGVREVVKGWTPESRGVFTDLNRARHQLASGFKKNSSGISPAASGTDIFGALWHFKTLFESGSRETSKTIWIFSDMMNETREFPMPTLLTNGAEKMLEQVKSNGLLVPLKGYKVYVYGAAPSGLTPQAWLTIKDFWTLYFQAAGAELVTYSAECEVER
jgi:YD repeat-containing protein